MSQDLQRIASGLVLQQIFERVLFSVFWHEPVKFFPDVDPEFLGDIRAALYPKIKTFHESLSLDGQHKQYDLLKCGRYGHKASDVIIEFDIVNARLKNPNDKILAKLSITLLDPNNPDNSHTEELCKIKFDPEKSEAVFEKLLAACEKAFHLCSLTLLLDSYIASKASEPVSKALEMLHEEMAKIQNQNRSKPEPEVDLSEFDGDKIQVSDEVSDLLSKYSSKGDNDDFLF